MGSENHVCFIAHRGYSSKHHENTEEAFIAAAEHGSGGIETDVRVTADGVLILSHNAELVFEDGTELSVKDSTYEQLTAKFLKNKRSDSKVKACTFRRYLEICRDNHMVCFIELKGSFPDEKIIEAFRMAEEVYDLSMCELQSFDFDNLVRAHNEFPALKIMLTCGSHDGDVDRSLECGFDIDMDYKGIKKETVDLFHKKGLKVGLWTANTPEALEFCLGQNVDFIESDVYSGKEI